MDTTTFKFQRIIGNKLTFLTLLIAVFVQVPITQGSSASAASVSQNRAVAPSAVAAAPDKSAPLRKSGTVDAPTNADKAIKPVAPPKSTESAEVRDQKAQEALERSFAASEGILTAAAIAALVVVVVIGWLVLANRPSVLGWQMYRCLHKNRIAKMPDSATDALILVPEVIASGLAKGANGNRHSDVSEHTELILGRDPVWRSTLNGNDWFSRIFCSDSGFIEVSARRLGTPVLHRKRFLIGENSPLWCFLLGWLPFSSIIERSYQKDVEGKWSLVFVCPWFRFTWLGTLIPTSGFVVRVSPMGMPQFVGLEKAKKLYPELPLFPKAMAELYALAYAIWCGGLRDQLLRRSRPLSFYEYEPDQEISSARIESFASIGQQYTVLLGLPQEQGGALHSVVMFDIQTGEPRLFERDSTSVIYGPIEAINTVSSEFNKSNHRYGAPRLFCSGGRLYWLVTVLGFPLRQEDEESLALIGHRVVDASTNCLVDLPGGVSTLLSDVNALRSL